MYPGSLSSLQITPASSSWVQSLLPPATRFTHWHAPLTATALHIVKPNLTWNKQNLSEHMQKLIYICSDWVCECVQERYLCPCHTWHCESSPWQTRSPAGDRGHGHWPVRSHHHRWFPTRLYKTLQFGPHCVSWGSQTDGTSESPGLLLSEGSVWGSSALVVWFGQSMMESKHELGRQQCVATTDTAPCAALWQGTETKRGRFEKYWKTCCYCCVNVSMFWFEH